MKFQIESFDVEVFAGKPEVCYLKDDDGSYRKVHFSAPESLIHLAFKKEFEEYVLRCVKMHQQKVSLSKRAIDAGIMRYVPPKVLVSKYSAYEFRKKIESRVGDIDEAKETWDYNKAPAGSAFAETKFGDLKAFLEMRKGDKLNLTGE